MSQWILGKTSSLCLWPSRGAGYRGGWATSIIGDVQNPAGHGPQKACFICPALSHFLSCRLAPMLAKASFPLEAESTGTVHVCTEWRQHRMCCMGPAEGHHVLAQLSAVLTVSHRLSPSLCVFLLRRACQSFACSAQCGYGLP